MKKVIGLISLIIFLLTLPFSYSGIQFLSHYSDIRKIVDAADSEEQTLPQPIKGMLQYSFSKNTTTYPTRLLIHQFYANESFAGHTTTWKIKSVSWHVILNLMTSEQDRMTIVAQLASLGGGHVGLSNASLAMFGLPLSKLSQTQAATLVVLIKQPSLYSNPQHLSQRRDEFLLHYQNSKKLLTAN